MKWRAYQQKLGRPQPRIECAGRTSGERQARRRELQGVVAGWSLILVMLTAVGLVAVKGVAKLVALMVHAQ